MSELNGSRRFGIHLDATLKTVRQDLIRRFKNSQIDLTPEQFTLLDELSKGKSMAQKELADQTFKDAPTVSRIVDLLVARGLLDREMDPLDKRKFILNLTPKGEGVYGNAAPIVIAARQDAWKDLSNADFDQFRRILEKISSNLS